MFELPIVFSATLVFLVTFASTLAEIAPFFSFVSDFMTSFLVTVSFFATVFSVDLKDFRIDVLVGFAGVIRELASVVFVI